MLGSAPRQPSAGPLGPLFPGIPYDLHFEQPSWDLGFLGQGSQNYTPIVLSGRSFLSGQTVDLGVLDLHGLAKSRRRARRSLPASPDRTSSARATATRARRARR